MAVQFSIKGALQDYAVARTPSPEDPIRAELVGIERLEQIAEALAAQISIRNLSGELNPEIKITF